MKYWFPFFALIGLVSACGSKHAKIISVDPKFHTYISAYSSGMQSRTQNIRIELQEGVDSSLIQKYGAKHFEDPKFLEQILEISPAVKGNFQWENGRVVVFIPDKPLSSNTLYTVSLDLEKVALVENGYETFTFQVATYDQQINPPATIVRIQDDYNLQYCSVTGTISTTDYADTSEIRKSISATFKGKSVPIHLTSEGYNNEFDFRIDSITRTEEDENLIVEWDGEGIGSRSKGTKNVLIPSVHNFEMTEWTVEDKDDQMVLLTFSEPISTEQQLDGLIEIEGINNLTYRVEHNIVYVFLPNRIEGERTLKISSGIRNIKNHGMKNRYEKKLEFRSPSPRIRMKGEGSILPDSKGLIFPFESIALKSVTVRIQRIYENNVHHFLQVNNLDGSDELLRFGKKLIEKKVDLQVPENEQKQWTQHVLSLEKWIRPEQGAIYRIGIKFDRSDAVCNCPTNSASTEEEISEMEEEEDWSEDTWESYYWDNGYDHWEYYEESDSPCLESYYHGKAMSRNILASNIGILFKLDEDKTAHAFLTNMLTAAPLANAEVDYVDYTKQVIRSGKTDDQGMLTLPLPRKPFLLVAKYGVQRGYLKLGDGYSNSLSKFDVEGETVQNDIKGYIYGERGVWRPGDSLYLNFVLQDQRHKIPKNHPVKFTLRNPVNTIVNEQTATSSVNNHYDFRTATFPDATTGIYEATVEIGDVRFQKWLKIETVKPNRLKMKLHFSDEEDSIVMESSWLHGAPANSLRAQVEVNFRAEPTLFEKFKNYFFDSPVRSDQNNTVIAYDDKLNKNGKCTFKLTKGNFAESPGKLKAVYTTRVFEKSGNFSIDRMSLPFSPFDNYVGISVPFTSESALINGKQHRFPLVVVDEKGEKIQTSKSLRVKIYRMEWRWWYEESADDDLNFLGRNGNRIVFDTTIMAQQGQGEFQFGLPQKDFGRFMILVQDEAGGHQTGKIVSIDFPSWERSNGRTNEFAAMLPFSCDKKEYIKGEMVKVIFPSPSAGKALISVETRKKVVKKFWVNTVKGETVATFPATEDMAPNAFVHVTLIQPHSSTVNDLPIRMYGIVPIFVDDPQTHLHPVLKVAKEWRPEAPASITVQESSGHDMTYTLAIVDDGLLDLTRFKTPNPWGTFFAKEALGVRTWDMYKDVIGAYAGKLDKLLSVGGDGEANDGAGPKANRFKPMVHFLGPFVLPAGNKKTHTISLPSYIGSVRVMVVAHNEKAYGSTEETVLIKKPLMILGTLPRVMGPNETILIPVDVFAMETFIQDVTVECSTNALLQLTKGKSNRVHFDAIGDEMTYFEVKVGDQLGIAKIKLSARCGNETATQEFEVDIRSANPISVQSQTFQLEAGKSTALPIKLDGIPGSHRLIVETSTGPSINLSGRLRELIHYPYGCIEQTTSAVFPQLMALQVMDGSEEDKKSMETNVKAGLIRLQSFQVSEGGFSYWPGENGADTWGTNYAGHFILEAESRGYVLPAGMKSNWIQYQLDKAKNWENDGSYIAHSRATESHQLIQAYRLFTLALAGSSDLSSMNRMRETIGLKPSAKWRLAAAYQLAGQDEIAQQMISGLTFKTDPYQELSYTYGSGLRDKAMFLETCQLIDPQRSAGLAEEIADQLSSNRWMSTQETGYCLLALTSGSPKKKNGIHVSIQNLGGQTYSIVSKKKCASLSFNENTINNSPNISLKNNSNERVYVTVSLEKVAKSGFEKTENKGLNMNVFYTDLNGKKINPKQIKQGSDFFVEVHLTNPTPETLYKEMSLAHIFPSGWEIHNTRFLDGSSSSDKFRYQDIRDDRVYTFYDLAPKETRVIKIQLNASYKGRFYVPGIYSEAMYKRSIHSQVKGFWTEVI